MVVPDCTVGYYGNTLKKNIIITKNTHIHTTSIPIKIRVETFRNFYSK